MEHIPDSVYVDLYLSGVEEAFKALLERYTYRIRCQIKKYYLSGYTEEDFFQIAALGFYEAVCSYEQMKDCTFWAYAMRIVTNKLNDEVRKVGKTEAYVFTTPLLPKLCESLSSYYYIATPDDILMAKEKQNEPYQLKLKEVLFSERLFTPLEKQCLLLFLEEYTYSQIAKEVGQPYKVVDNALARAKKKIKKEFEGITLYA